MEDVNAVVALERSIESAPRWGRAIYREMLAVGEGGVRRALIIAERAPGASRDGDAAAMRVVGFAVGAMRENGEVELESVAVATGVWRAGVGSALVQAVATWAAGRQAREMALEVRASNEAAVALYSRLGFLEVGRRPRYYTDPVEDATVMKLDLTRSSSGEPEPCILKRQS